MYDYSGLSGLQKVIMQLIDGAFGSTPLTADSLKFGDANFEAVNTLWNQVAILGVLLLCIYFVWNINRIMLMEGNDFTWKSLGSVFLKFGIGYAFIAHGSVIFSALFGMNDALINSVSTSDGSWYSSARDSLLSSVKDASFLECIGLLISTAIISLTGALVCAVIGYQAVSRKIEMMLRAGLAPIALGDMFNGEQSNGWRYIKKFIALAFWGLAMIVIVNIGTELQLEKVLHGLEELSLTSLSALFDMILIPLAEAGMCATAKQVCNDVMGV